MSLSLVPGMVQSCLHWLLAVRSLGNCRRRARSSPEAAHGGTRIIAPIQGLHSLQYLEMFQYSRNYEEIKRCERLPAPVRGSDACSLNTCANFKPRLPMSTLRCGHILFVHCALRLEYTLSNRR